MKTLYLLKYRKTSRYFVYLVCLVIFAISFIASKTPFPVVAQAAWMCHLCDVRVCKPIRSVRSVVVNASISIKKKLKRKKSAELTFNQISIINIVTYLVNPVCLQ